MTTFAPWSNCQRCSRSSCRWGIYAPVASAPKVLVLSASASRASQVIGARDPHVALVVALICRDFKLPRAAVHADVLLACGPAVEAEGHEAAGCAQRLDDQASLNNWPLRLVVLVGDYTARLARRAGLLTVAGFRLAAKTHPAVVVREFWDVGLDPQWQMLGPVPALLPEPPRFPTAVPIMWKVVQGRCTGHAWRPFTGEWKREDSPPTKDLVEAHVDGYGWLSPFKPVGEWPYCVIDVDLHNAIQDVKHDATIRRLTALFKKSLFFRSSAAGGVHVFVRLPPRISYPDAACWLAEFLFLKNLLFDKSTPARFATVKGAVATQLAEVPLHPPRLPFGFGSALRGSSHADAVARFEKWLKKDDFADFEAARTAVQQQRLPRPRWPDRAAWARTYIHDLELEALTITAKSKTLPPTDPWAPYLSRLTPNVAALATYGCPAFGTRTATMMRLADALAEIVEPRVARDLLRHWVEARDHRSEDIAVDREMVLDFADKLVDDAFEGRGIPESVWLAAKAAVKTLYANIAAGTAATVSLTEEECQRAAFHIIELFYENKRGETFIAAEQLGLALKKDDAGGLPVWRPYQNRVAAVREALETVGIIKMTGGANHLKNKAAEYELLAPYWPPPPTGGPMRYQPV